MKILDDKSRHNFFRCILLLHMRACCLLLATLTIPALNQAPDPAYKPTLTFDVASIHESKADSSYTIRVNNPLHDSSVRLINNSVSDLLEVAYGVKHYQLNGLPQWTEGRIMYNIEAKSDTATDEKLAKLTDKQAALEKQHMLQALLADRFHLQLHRETKDEAVLALVLASRKSGPRFHLTANAPPTPEDLERWGHRAIPPIYERNSVGGRHGLECVCHACTMADLAPQLAARMDSPIEDRTGLTGKYDFLLQYNGRFPSIENDNSYTFPALTDALPAQLGLKLEPSRGQTTFLVIDTLEKPTAN